MDFLRCFVNKEPNLFIFIMILRGKERIQKKMQVAMMIVRRRARKPTKN